MSSRLDLTPVWDDAKAMARANGDLLIAVAGMFLLLPLAVGLQLMERPPLPPQGASQDAILQWYEGFFAANLPVMIGVTIITSFGILAILTLLLRPERLTVAESLKAALRVLPGYVLANLLQQFGVMAGLTLFLLPGFYLIGRFALVGAASAAENDGNPFSMLRRSAELTRGNGWRLFGLLAVIMIVVMVVNIIASILIGLVATLLLPADLAEFAISLVSAFTWTAIFTLTALVTAAFYRAATAPTSAPWAPGR